MKTKTKTRTAYYRRLHPDVRILVDALRMLYPGIAERDIVGWIAFSLTAPRE